MDYCSHVCPFGERPCRLMGYISYTCVCSNNFILWWIFTKFRQNLYSKNICLNLENEWYTFFGVKSLFFYEKSWILRIIALVRSSKSINSFFFFFKLYFQYSAPSVYRPPPFYRQPRLSPKFSSVPISPVILPNSATAIRHRFSDTKVV